MKIQEALGRGVSLMMLEQSCQTADRLQGSFVGGGGGGGGGGL